MAVLYFQKSKWHNIFRIRAPTIAGARAHQLRNPCFGCDGRIYNFFRKVSKKLYKIETGSSTIFCKQGQNEKEPLDLSYSKKLSFSAVQKS